MAVGDIGNSIQQYEFETTYGRHPVIEYIRPNLFCIAFTNPTSDTEVRSFIISDAGVITTPAEDSLTLEAASGNFAHACRRPDQNLVVAYQEGGGNVGIEAVLVANDGTLTQHANHYCSAGILSAFNFNIVYQRDSIVTLLTDHSAGIPFVITFGVSEDGIVATPRKSFVSLDAALSTYPQGIRVSDSKFLGAYNRTGTDVYARPMNIAADGAVTGLGQATTQIANLNAFPSTWIHLKDNWFILALAGPGVALNLCAIECAPDGTFTIPANNTFQVNADKGTDPQMVKLDDNTVAIFSRDSADAAWLSTVRITTGDPVAWSNQDTKSLGATLTKGSGIALSGQDVVTLSYSDLGDDGYLWTYETKSEPPPSGHHELVMGSGP